MQRRFKVILEKNENNGYTVTVPALPGCVTQGKNKDEALERIQEAIQGYLEALKIEGLPIPDSDIDIAEVEVAYGA
ncbi:MAG: type II toxin-antitoxin system HicB family antitoxin [Bacillota bacterium]|nr:type II toxin-antitoxin system HicB family antitoxin [Bacillota bacterium]